MTRFIKKKMLFLVGIFFTGLLGIVGQYLRSNYSKSDSVIIPTVKADTPPSCGWCGCPYSDSECNNYWYCFPFGTAISAPSGYKEIQDVVSGDIVYGFNIETGEKGEYEVTRTFKHGKDDTNGVASPLLVITHEKGTLTVTDNHLIYRKNGREGEFANFDRAGVLQVNDMLTLENGEESRITGIESGPEYDFVYNLEVKEVHTYFADGVRVHNSGGTGCCGSTGK